MTDGEPCAAFVVRQKAERVLILDLREHVDHRQAARGRLDRGAPVGPPRGDHETVDPLAEKLIDMAPLAQRVVGGVAHEDRHAMIEQAPLERLDDRESKPSETVVGKDADRHRPRPMQALRQIVRPVAEVSRGGRDPFAGLPTQAAVVVERFGNGAYADIGSPRDVADGWVCARVSVLASIHAVDRSRRRLTRAARIRGHFNAPLVNPDT